MKSGFEGDYYHYNQDQQGSDDEGKKDDLQTLVDPNEQLVFQGKKWRISWHNRYKRATKRLKEEKMRSIQYLEASQALKQVLQNVRVEMALLQSANTQLQNANTDIKTELKKQKQRHSQTYSNYISTNQWNNSIITQQKNELADIVKAFRVEKIALVANMNQQQEESRKIIKSIEQQSQNQYIQYKQYADQMAQKFNQLMQQKQRYKYKYQHQVENSRLQKLKGQQYIDQLTKNINQRNQYIASLKKQVYSLSMAPRMHQSQMQTIFELQNQLNRVAQHSSRMRQQLSLKQGEIDRLTEKIHQINSKQKEKDYENIIGNLQFDKQLLQKQVFSIKQLLRSQMQQRESQMKRLKNTIQKYKIQIRQIATQIPGKDKVQMQQLKGNAIVLQKSIILKQMTLKQYEKSIQQEKALTAVLKSRLIQKESQIHLLTNQISAQRTQLIVVEPYGKDFYIGQKIVSKQVVFYTRRSVTLKKQTLGDIKRQYQSMKNKKQSTAYFQSNSIMLIKDVYRGQTFYGIRYASWYRGKVMPGKRGINLTQSDFLLVLDKIKTIIS